MGSDFQNLIAAIPGQFIPSVQNPKEYSLSRDPKTGNILIQTSKSDASVDDSGRLEQTVQLDADGIVSSNSISYDFALSPINGG